MAKHVTKKQTPRRSEDEDVKNLPSKVGSQGDLATIPQDLMTDMAADSGRGVSHDASDYLVPLIYVLQALSPQALKRNPAYINGAEAGSIWLRNASNPIVPGDHGIYFLPAAFYKNVVEWIPRNDGGGFVGIHNFLDVGDTVAKVAERVNAKQVPDPTNAKRIRWMTKDGHELIETRYHVGYVFWDGRPMPYVLPLSSTGHTFSKEWMNRMGQKTLPNGQQAPSYSYIYRLYTQFKQNNLGEWFGWAVEDIGWVYDAETYRRIMGRRGTPAEYAKVYFAAKGLNRSFDSGEKQAEEPQANFDGGISVDDSAM